MQNFGINFSRAIGFLRVLGSGEDREVCPFDRPSEEWLVMTLDFGCICSMFFRLRVFFWFQGVGLWID